MYIAAVLMSAVLFIYSYILPSDFISPLFLYAHKDFANQFFMLFHLIQTTTRDQETILKNSSDFTILKSSKHISSRYVEIPLKH